MEPGEKVVSNHLSDKKKLGSESKQRFRPLITPILAIPSVGACSGAPASASRRHDGDATLMGKGGRGSASEATADDEFFVHIHGKKIDCRKWSRSHPGGSKALRIFKDRDAT